MPNSSTLTCTLFSYPGPGVLAFEDTQQAVRDFDRQVGAPYAALYIQKVMGRGEQASRCIRVVQRSATQFMRYTYHAQRIDSARINNASWQAPFGQLTPGHYNSVCDTGTMDGSYWFLQVKQGTAVTFSLGLESAQYSALVAADKARVAPAIDLIRLITQ